jgi:hypothetical protein
VAVVVEETGRRKAMSRYEYDDGLCPGGRRPRLYLAKGGQVQKFAGKNIPGFCAVVTEVHTPDGKWSRTRYVLELAPGVRPLHFLSPLHGTWGETFESWGAVAEFLSLPIEVAQQIVRDEYPRTAERLDRLEQFALEVEALGSTTETVIISFGSPTRRQVAEGFWERPRSATTSEGRKVTVAPNPTWDTPTVVEPEGATVISVRHKPGMHGGYWTIEVAVPAGIDR